MMLLRRYLLLQVTLWTSVILRVDAAYMSHADSTKLLLEFVDAHPENKTVSIGSKVAFHCLIRSQKNPTIKWFKRITSTGTEYEDPQNLENSSASIIVQYNGQKYKLLHTTNEKTKENEIYCSELILEEVTLADEGFYACVAGRLSRRTFREAYLRVDDIVDNENEEDGNYWDDYDTSDEQIYSKELSTRNTALWPVVMGILVIPVLILLCYLDFKERSKRLRTTSNEGYDLQSTTFLRLNK